MFGVVVDIRVSKKLNLSKAKDEIAAWFDYVY